MKQTWSTLRKPLGIAVSIAALQCAGSNLSHADVAHVEFSDVTTRAASIVWASSEPVTSASVRVFLDSAGTSEVTSALGQLLESASFPEAHERGIVKVTITGLDADTDYFVSTSTTGESGETVVVPDDGSLLRVRSAAQTTKANAENAPITNDLIEHEIAEVGGTVPAAGALLLLQVGMRGGPGGEFEAFPYPVSAFVGEGFVPPAAVVDLNNIYDDSGVSAEVVSDSNTFLLITEYRGLPCTLDEHRLFRFRKVPAHEEFPAITELEDPAGCFFVDHNCNNVVDIEDAQRVLNQVFLDSSQCVFNSDFDLDADEEITIDDAQRVLNQIGQDV